MPAQTASLRSAYSWAAIDLGSMVGACALPGSVLPANAPLPGPLPGGERELFLVRGKLSHRCCDFGWVGHYEFLLWRVEGHRRHVLRCDPHHRSIQVVERVLGDDGGHLRAKATGEVVLVDHHRLACLA